MAEREQREFEADGQSWIAWTSGAGAYGTGVLGTAQVAAVHFGRPDAPEVPVLEALAPAGDFHALFDDELIQLLRSARPIVEPIASTERRRPRSLSE